MKAAAEPVAHSMAQRAVLLLASDLLLTASACWGNSISGKKVRYFRDERTVSYSYRAFHAAA